MPGGYLQPVVAEFRANVTQAVTALGELRAEIASVEKSLTKVGGELITLEGRLQTSARTMTIAGDGMVFLGDQSTILEGRLIKAREGTAGLSQSVGGLNRSATSLADRLAVSGDAVSAFASKFAGVDSSLTAFGERLTILDREMRTMATSIKDAATSMLALSAAADKASVSNAQLERSSAKAAASAKEIHSSLLMVGAAAGIMDFALIKAGGNMQDQMVRLQTEAGLSDQSIKQFAGSMSGLEDRVLATGQAVGQTGTHMAKSLYEPVSAGLSLATSLDVAKYAAWESKLAGSDLEATTTALTTTMKSFGASLGGPEQGMAMLNSIVGHGRMRFAEFNESVKNWAPTASTFGVSLDSVGAGLAFMTDRGESAQTAGTKLAQVMAMMVGQTTQAGKLMQGLGLSTDEVATSNDAMATAMSKAHITTSELAKDLQQPNGLYVAVNHLKTSMEGAGLSAEGAESILVRAFGGGRQFKGLAELIHDTGDLKNRWEQIVHDGNIAHFEEQWKKLGETFKFQWESMIASMGNFSIAIGRELLPAATSIARVLGDLFHGIGSNKPLVDALAAGFGTLAVALPVAAIGMFISKMSETATAVTMTTVKLGLLAAGFEYGVTHADSFTGQLSLVVSGLVGIKTAIDLMSGPLSSLSDKLSTSKAAFGTFMADIASAPTKFAKVSTAVSGVTSFLAGPWGIALGVAAVGLGMLMSRSGETSHAVDDLTRAIEADSGALGKNSQEWIANELQKSGVLKNAQALGISTDLVTKAILGEGNAADELNSRLNAIKDNDAAEQAKSQGEQWTGALGQTGRAAEKLQDQVGGMTGNIKASTAASKEHQSTLSTVNGVLKDNATVSGEAASAQATLSTAMTKVTDALKGASEAAKKLNDMFDVLNGGNIGAEKAFMSFKDSVDKVSDSIGKNATTLDENTKAGRDNMTAILAGVDAAKSHASAVANQTGSVQKGMDTFRADIDVLKENLRHLGLNEDQVKRLGDSYMNLPPERVIKLLFPGLEHGAMLMGEVQDRMNGLTDKTVNIRINHIDNTPYQEVPGRGKIYATGGLVQHFASGGISRFPTGGPVFGPGTTTSDSIPAMLSNREFVINADAVQKATVPVLDALNSGDLTGARDLLSGIPGAGGSDGAAMPSPMRGSSGGTVNNYYTVHVHVAGNVQTERDLVDAIERQMLQLGGRRNQTWASYSR